MYQRQGVSPISQGRPLIASSSSGITASSGSAIRASDPTRHARARATSRKRLQGEIKKIRNPIKKKLPPGPASLSRALTFKNRAGCASFFLDRERCGRLSGSVFPFTELTAASATSKVPLASRRHSCSWLGAVGLQRDTFLSRFPLARCPPCSAARQGRASLMHAFAG